MPPSVAAKDSPQDCVLDEGPCADHWTLQGELSPEYLQVDGREYCLTNELAL